MPPWFAYAQSPICQFAGRRAAGLNGRRPGAGCIAAPPQAASRERNVDELFAWLHALTRDQTTPVDEEMPMKLPDSISERRRDIIDDAEGLLLRLRACLKNN